MTTADVAAIHAISARIRAVPRIDPDAPALEYEGRWSPWSALANAIDLVGPVVTTPGRQVGILLRNRPCLVGALLGVLSAGGCVVTPGCWPAGGFGCVGGCCSAGAQAIQRWNHATLGPTCVRDWKRCFHN